MLRRMYRSQSIRRSMVGLLLLMLLIVPSAPTTAAQESTDRSPLTDMEHSTDLSTLTDADWSAIEQLLPPEQRAYLKASNTGADDAFGSSVALYNNTLVVGAAGESSAATGVNGTQKDNTAPDAGAVYVFERYGTTWQQHAYLKASNTDAGDNFGGNVAIFGNTIVVGAIGEDSAATGVNGNQVDNSAPDSGAVYVFVRRGTTWQQYAYLKASNTDAGDNFGNSVAIHGTTLVVGAPFEDSAATKINGDQADNAAEDSGAAYVFVPQARSWGQQAYLKASNSEALDAFGWSVDIFAHTIVVGAPFEDSSATTINGDQDDNAASFAGAAYVFKRQATNWQQQTYLKASNTDADDFFGWSVDIFATTIAVTALYESSAATGVNGDQADNSAPLAGAAYIFVAQDTTWVQQAYLKASNTDAADFFGIDVALYGNVLVVGAFFEDSAATGVNGDQADNSAPDAGAAYVFLRNKAGTWTQQTYLKASNTDAGDYFGNSVTIFGQTLAVGAIFEDSESRGINGDQANNSAPDAGAVYIFDLFPRRYGTSSLSQQ